jgi:hypothetical protein
MGMSFTYRLKSAGEKSPLWVTAARMTRHVNVADWKDDWKVRQSRYDDTVPTRYDGKFRTVNL